jgi:YVTN family beta-propeller protein
VSVFNTETNEKVAEITVGDDPRSLAVAPDGAMWVVNKGSSSLSIINTANLQVAKTVDLPVAAQPHGMVFDSVNKVAFIALEATEALIKLDLNAKIISQLALAGPPRHLSLTGDGKQLFAPRYITAPLPGEETKEPRTAEGGADVYVIDASTMTLSKTIVLAHSNRPDSEKSGRGIPNYLGPLVLSPDGLTAWLPSKSDNIARGGLRDGRPLTHDSTVRAISSYVHLDSFEEDINIRLDHDNASVAGTALFDSLGTYIFVTLETNREVAVIDAYSKKERLRFGTGKAPEGLALSADGNTLYVDNFTERTVTVHDISKLVSGASFEVTQLQTYKTVVKDALSPQVLLGKQLFYDAKDSRLSRESYMSCATCHNDGGYDGRTWDFTSLGEGLRNTPSLRGKAGSAHGRLHWSANFDEVQDFEGQIRSLAGGTGLMADKDFLAGTRKDPLGDSKAGISNDLDALSAYVNSLSQEDASPFRASTGLSEKAIQGKQVFEQSSCSSCHSGPIFNANSKSSESLLYDIGTLKESSGKRLGQALAGIQPPSLKGLWDTAPYLHDGSAANLQAALRAHQNIALSDTELNQLEAYLQELDKNEDGPTLFEGIQIYTVGKNTLEAETLQDVPALQLRMSSNTPLELTSLVLRLETGDIATIANAKLVLDQDGNGLLSQAEKALSSTIKILGEDTLEVTLSEPLNLTLPSSKRFVLNVDLQSSNAYLAGSSLAFLLLAGLFLRRKRRWALLGLILALSACGGGGTGPTGELKGANYQFVLEGMTATHNGEVVKVTGLPLEGAAITIK